MFFILGQEWYFLWIIFNVFLLKTFPLFFHRFFHSFSTGAD